MAHEKIGETVEELERIREMLNRRIGHTYRKLETLRNEFVLVVNKIEALKKEGNKSAQS